MARAGAGMIAAALALAACVPAASRQGAAPDGPLRIEIEEILAPDVFQVEGPARVAGAQEAPGLWAAAPGLPRPERGELRDLSTGETVTVSLFRASGSGIRVSRAAAETVGLASGSTVRLTAVRSQPRVLAFDRGEGLSYSDQAP